MKITLTYTPEEEHQAKVILAFLGAYVPECETTRVNEEEATA